MSDEARRIFSVIGTLPEPGGYAVAKFSRSARPYQEWIEELTQEGASRFYDQFYFAYGHASIADLAHVTMVAENISITAAIELLDDPLIDAQESSTRYQDFTKRTFFTPPEIAAGPLAAEYANVCVQLFETYRATHRTLAVEFERQFSSQRPAEMPDAEYRRIIRARAFDVARYLLPSSTYTGLGYLCSARTLERQIARLASHRLAEMRQIADELRRAAIEPAFNPLARGVERVMESYFGNSESVEAEALATALHTATAYGAAAAPTLVRYTEASPYLTDSYPLLHDLVSPLVAHVDPDGERGVTLAAPSSLLDELAATVIYRASEVSYRQAVDIVERLDPAPRAALCDSIFRERGPHDEPLREARAGYSLIFDLCLDNGAFRDLHRHRNCVQIIKDFSRIYGYDTPSAIPEIGQDSHFRSVMDAAGELAGRLEELQSGLGQYALPLAYRRRALFKMDASELGYIAETRTKPAGHFSYREIAHQMYEAYAARFPELARHVRVTDPTVEEFFER